MRARTSRWANSALFFGLAAWVISGGGVVIAVLLEVLMEILRQVGYGPRDISAYFVVPFFLTCIASSIIGFASSVVALIAIKLRKGVIEGKGRAVWGLSLSLLYFLVMLCIFVPATAEVRRLAESESCRRNLWKLSKAMSMYANDYDGKYPTAGQWCDLLIQGGYVTEEQFKCPRDKEGPCSYAMNPNAEPNSPWDVVLLFESTPGWNQVGGPELLTIENHRWKHKWKGCNILFKDGHVEFVWTEQLAELKWKVEEKAK